MGSSSLWWLNQETHSRVASSTDSLVFHGARRWISSALYKPLMVSASALTLLCQEVPCDFRRSASINGYSSRTTYRFRHRWISLVDKPCADRRATYSRVRGSLRIRTMAMVQRALFAERSPPRFKRWRFVFPDDASARVKVVVASFMQPGQPHSSVAPGCRQQRRRGRQRSGRRRQTFDGAERHVGL